MNDHHTDDFLHQLREPPSPEFTHQLAARLTTIDARATRRAPWSALPRLTPRRATLAAASLGALALAVVALTNPFAGGPSPADAQAILERAQTAAASPAASYHLRATSQQADGTTSSIESWSRGPNYKTEEVTRNAAGAVVRRSGGGSTPTQAWKWFEQNGQTHASIFTIPEGKAGAGASGGKLEAITLDGLIAALGQRGCGTAERQGDATVAGRPAYVVAVTFGACAGAKPGALGPGSRTVTAVDRETFLLLRNETADPAGRLVSRYEVTSIEYNVSIPDSVFTYTPPPGAIVDRVNADEPKPGAPAKPTPTPAATR